MNAAYRRMKQKQPVACRLSEMADLLDAATIFDVRRYTPEPGSPGFQALSEYMRKSKGKGPISSHAEKVIKDAQRRGVIPGDEWSEPLSKLRAKIERWLFGEDRTLWPVLIPLATEVAKSRRCYDAIDVSSCYSSIGKHLASLAFSDFRSIRKLSTVIDRWHGASTKKEKHQEVETMAIAFRLWQTLKRNPTRKELYAELPEPISKANRENSDPDKERRDALRNAGLAFIK